MLHVVMNGQVIGDLGGLGRRLRLRYSPEAELEPAFVPLSVNMPATQPRWRGQRLDAWLAGLLPDRDQVLQHWRTQFGIQSLEVIDLLAHLGEDLAGAAQFVRDDRLETVLSRAGTVVPLNDDAVADLARAARRDTLPYDGDAQVGYFSLAGAQAKFALQKTPAGWALPSGAQPSTHIFKPAIPGLENQDVVEVVTMRLASELGLPTAHSQLVTIGGERLIEIERYDRFDVDGQWQRVHQEDLCQALGIHPLNKYEAQGGPGVAACAEVIRRTCGDQDVLTFARSVMFNYAVRGSDAHARNYSLLLTPGDVRLAPLYDLNSTLTFGDHWANRLAMRIGGEDRMDAIRWANWTQFAAEVGLDTQWVRDELIQMIDAVPDGLSDICSSIDEVRPIRDTLTDRAASWCKTVRQQAL